MTATIRNAQAEFASRYAARYGEAPNFSAVIGAEALFVLAEVTRAGRDPKKVRAALLSREFEGLLGPLRFDRNGDAVRPYRVFEVRNGAFEVLR